MAIEDTLERIAVALEAIANSKSGLTTGVASTAKVEAPKAETQKTRPGKKIEEKIEEGETSTEDEPAQEATGLDIKWPDVNKQLFSMLEQVRDVKGPDEAKATCAALMKKYSGGQKFSPGTVAPKSYKSLLADIEAELEALNG